MEQAKVRVESTKFLGEIARMHPCCAVEKRFMQPGPDLISDLRSEHGQRLDTLAADIARVGTEYRVALDKVIGDLVQRTEQATTIDAAGFR